MKERAGVNGGQERLKEIYIERLFDCVDDAGPRCRRRNRVGGMRQTWENVLLERSREIRNCFGW
jgi:hypothetical protein